MTKHLVVVVSDPHTISTRGLSLPIVTLPDGGKYIVSDAQRWMWRNWIEFWKRIWKIKKATGAYTTVIVNGDASDGDHHKTPQIITKDPDTMIELACAVLYIPRRIASEMYIVRGTEAHVGQGAWIEEAVARRLKARKSVEGTWSHWHLLAEFDGVIFDVMHHPESVSRRPWTAGADANRISAMVAYEYAASGDKIPNIALRAHIHSFRDSGTTHPVRTFITPPWQLKTHFANRIGAGGTIQPVGGLFFLCEKNSYRWDRIFFKPKRRAPMTPMLPEKGE